MSIKQYEAFVKIVEVGSLTRAAEELGCTQSGVSHMIAALEEDFGFVLLRRSRAGVQLTEEGRRVLPSIRGLLTYHEQLSQVVSEVHGLRAGTVRVAAFSSVAVHWLPGMLRSFQMTYPHIEFKLLNGDYHDIEQWLSEGAADLGFVTLPVRSGWTAVPLAEDPLVAILPQGHPLARAGRFPLAAAATEPMIGLLESSDHDLRRILAPAGLRPNVRFTTKDDYAIIAMVENGLGVSILPQLLLRGQGRSVAALPLDPPATRSIGLAVPDPARLSPAGRAFARHICTWVRQSRGADCLVEPDRLPF